MSAAGIIAILVLASLVTTIFTYGLKNKGPWNSIWTFFLIQLLCLWTVSLWVPPVGPVWYGTPWLDLIITAFFIAFMLAAFTPSSSEYRDRSPSLVDEDDIRTRSGNVTAMRTKKGNKVVIAAGSMFWMLLLFLTVLIIAGAAD